MVLSREMDRLQKKWNQGNCWPKRLEAIEIFGIRGWTGYRIDFNFPITAVVGENGAGKSTILQASAAAYKVPHPSRTYFASDFFPDTPWDQVTNAEIKFSIREGKTTRNYSVRKLTNRWRGNPERRERKVYYIDLSRIQPLSAREGYLRLAKSTLTEANSTQITSDGLSRLSTIMGVTYKSGKFAATSKDPNRLVPVVQREASPYSGFHQGAGEITAAELLAHDFEKYSLVVIDEIETSLHPRAQRRLIRDLAELARLREVQFILSTHSPYILEEVPPQGRIYIVEDGSGKSVVTGVSPEFAMTKMDLEKHPECDLYVEDKEAVTLLSEIIIGTDPDLISRVHISPFGSASVGYALGQMASEQRFRRPTIIYLDADQTKRNGIELLPGNGSPERFVFEELKKASWPDIADRVGRPPAEVIDALERAMLDPDHHSWPISAANPLHVGGSHLWQAMCASWVKNCSNPKQRQDTVQPILDVLP